MKRRKRPNREMRDVQRALEKMAERLKQEKHPNRKTKKQRRESGQKQLQEKWFQRVENETPVYLNGCRPVPPIDELGPFLSSVGTGDVTSAAVAAQIRKDSRRLRTWWHTVLRRHGKHSCYAILLVLPADGEAIRYAIYFGEELDSISGEDCCVLVLTDTHVKRSGFDDGLWRLAVSEQAKKGHSLTVAELFDIGYDEFPCLVVFRDIRSPEHILVKLKGMTTEGIAGQMRSLFTVVHRAASSKEDPLEAIERYQKQERIRGKTQAVVSQVRSLPGKTLEAAMEAWLKAIIAI